MTKTKTDTLENQILARLKGGETAGDIARSLDLEPYETSEGTIAVVLPGYWADDGNAALEYPDAESATEAAQEYVDGGSWGEVESTTWIHVRTWRVAIGPDAKGDACEWTISEGTIIVPIEPEEPECSHSGGHDWQSPYELLGGLRENPGVWGKGGGIVAEEVCMRCGCSRTTDTWAQDPETGAQGLESHSYEAGKYADEVREGARKAALDAAEAALREGGYDSRRRDDGDVALSVSDNDEDEGREALETIREIVREHGCTADWTGGSNTDDDGDTESDIRVEYAS
jgi:hypothetical protein